MGDLIQRMRLNFLLLGLSAHLGFAQRGRQKSATTSKTATTSKSAIGIVENAFEILGNVVDYKENIAISPLSIVGGMYMLAAGSAGNSRQQILKALKFGDALDDNKKLNRFREYYDLVSKLQTQPENGYTLDIANGIFHQKDMGQTSPNKLQGNYLDLLKENFIQDESHIRELDFQQKSQEATDEINKWVAEKTNNKIPQLFSEPLDSQTIVMLVSTLYFKASWNEKFESVRKDPPCYFSNMKDFLADPSTCDDVKYMGKEEEVYYTNEKTHDFGDVEIYDLALKSRKNKDGNDENKFLMQIWAPNSFVNTDEDIDRKFREYMKNNLMTVRRKMKKTLAKIKIPVFEIDSDIELKNAMQQIGITDVFGQQANLSPMLGEDQEAQVSKINHAVKITVDQNGVEGAAATSIQITSRTFSQPKLIHITRPFYFVISNRCWSPGSAKGCSNGNVPLFIGRVVNPVAPK